MPQFLNFYLQQKQKFFNFFSCRRILEVMIVLGIILNAMIKSVINIAILPMTEEFKWTESQKQDILGILFWGFSFSKIPCGRLSEVIGPRKVVGFSMLVASILTIFTPLLSLWNFYVLLVSRIVMGFLLGAFYPSVMTFASNWVPASERSSFLASISANGIGIAITYLSCGYFIVELGWKSTFYTTGIIVFLWSLLWFYLIYDSPQEHPRITLQEKESLIEQIEPKKINVKIFDVPWRKILSSGPVWAIAVTQIALFCGYGTMINELPSYVEQVLSYDIKKVGILSSLPFFVAYLPTLVGGHFADFLQKKQTVSTKSLRIIYETFGLGVSALMMILLAFWGDHAGVAVTCFAITIIVGCVGCLGHNANILDISRNFAGTISGFANMMGALTVYFSSKVLARLLEHDHSFNRWKYLFWTLCISYIIANILFVILCSVTLQKWDTKQEKELKPK